ncbi:UNVERIFIED_CONTAM: hypothetical protein HDU68_008318, partial [Siphonaria sp. JEL0065]
PHAIISPTTSNTQPPFKDHFHYNLSHFKHTSHQPPSSTNKKPIFNKKTQLVKNGLTKRTISLLGSDGTKHRVISYYRHQDILTMHEHVSKKEPAPLHGPPTSGPGIDSMYGGEWFRMPMEDERLVRLVMRDCGGDRAFRELLAKGIPGDLVDWKESDEVRVPNFGYISEACGDEVVGSGTGDDEGSPSAKRFNLEHSAFQQRATVVPIYGGSGYSGSTLAEDGSRLTSQAKDFTSVNLPPLMKREKSSLVSLPRLRDVVPILEPQQPTEPKQQHQQQQQQPYNHASFMPYLQNYSNHYPSGYYYNSESTYYGQTIAHYVYPSHQPQHQQFYYPIFPNVPPAHPLAATAPRQVPDQF